MSNKKGLLALSPLFLLIVLIVAFTAYSVDSSHCLLYTSDAADDDYTV